MALTPQQMSTLQGFFPNVGQGDIGQVLNSSGGNITPQDLQRLMGYNQVPYMNPGDPGSGGMPSYAPYQGASVYDMMQALSGSVAPSPTQAPNNANPQAVNRPLSLGSAPPQMQQQPSPQQFSMPSPAQLGQSPQAGVGPPQMPSGLGAGAAMPQMQQGLGSFNPSWLRPNPPQMMPQSAMNAGFGQTPSTAPFPTYPAQFNNAVARSPQFYPRGIVPQGVPLGNATPK